MSESLIEVRIPKPGRRFGWFYALVGVVGLFCLVQFGWGMEYPLAAAIFIVGWFVGFLCLSEYTPVGDWLDSKAKRIPEDEANLRDIMRDYRDG